MQYGIHGAAVPSLYRYANAVNQAANEEAVSPIFVYSIFWRETIQCEMTGCWNASTVISPDGGHGLGQITPPNPIPANWQDPYTNAKASIAILKPGFAFWAGKGYVGPTLIMLSAATYNAGLGNVEAGHEHGDLDEYTSSEYGHGVLANYCVLVTGKKLQYA